MKFSSMSVKALLLSLSTLFITFPTFTHAIFTQPNSGTFLGSTLQSDDSPNHHQDDTSSSQLSFPLVQCYGSDCWINTSRGFRELSSSGFRAVVPPHQKNKKQQHGFLERHPLAPPITILRGGHSSALDQPPPSNANSIPSRSSSIPSSLQTNIPSHPDHERTTPKRKRLMDYESVALALRLTCEMNRRLHGATASLQFWGLPRGGGGNNGSKGALTLRPRHAVAHLHMELVEGASSSASLQHPPSLASTIPGGGYGAALHAHGGQVYTPPTTHDPTFHNHPHPHSPPPQHHPHSSVVNVHPSQQWHTPIRIPTQHEALQRTKLTSPTSTTTSTPFDTPRHHLTTDLQTHLQTILHSLNCQDSPVVLALALIYLDRACSVETPREEHHPPCPYITSRTVHRLILTAIVLSHRVVSSRLDWEDASVTRHYVQLLEQVEGGGGSGVVVTEEELWRMQRWMLGALGEEGLSVDSERVEGFLRDWRGLFVWEKEDDESGSGMGMEMDGDEKVVSLEESGPGDVQEVHHQDKNEGGDGDGVVGMDGKDSKYVSSSDAASSSSSSLSSTFEGKAEGQTRQAQPQPPQRLQQWGMATPQQPQQQQDETIHASQTFQGQSQPKPQNYDSSQGSREDMYGGSSDTYNRDDHYHHPHYPPDMYHQQVYEHHYA